MAVFKFPAAEVAKLVELSKNAPKRRPVYSQMIDPAFRLDGKKGDFNARESDVDQTKIPAGLWLVGDQGVYLMSNAAEQEKNDKGRLPVVYAQGLNPDVDEDFYEQKRAMYGGDDGSDFLPVDMFEQVLQGQGGVQPRFVKIKLTTRDISVYGGAR